MKRGGRARARIGMGDEDVGEAQLRQRGHPVGDGAVQAVPRAPQDLSARGLGHRATSSSSHTT